MYISTVKLLIVFIFHKINTDKCLIFDTSNLKDGEKIFMRQLRGVELPDYQTAEMELVRLQTLTKDQIENQAGLNNRLKEYALLTDQANYSAQGFYQSQVKVTNGFWGGIKAINMYNAQSDIVSRGKMAEAIRETNAGLGQQLVQLNGAKASLGAYVKSEAWSFLKNIGSQIASGLMSAGINIAISLIVSGVTNLIQKQKELREQTLETGETAKQEASQVKDAFRAYSEAKSSYDDSATAKENLTNKTDELLKALGYEEDEIESLRKKYGDLDDAINTVTRDTLNDKYRNIFAAYIASLDELESKTKDTFAGGDYSRITVGKEANKAFVKQLEDNGYKFKDEYINSAVLSSIDFGDIYDLDSAKAAKDQLDEMLEILEEGQKQGLYGVKEYQESPLYKTIFEKRDDIEKAISEVEKYQTSLNDILSQMLYLDVSKKNGIPETQEQFDKFRDDMIETAQGSDEYKNLFLGTTKDIIDSIDATLNGMPSLSEFIITDEDEKEAKQKADEWINNINKAFNERFGYFSKDKWNFVAEIVPELKENELEVLLKLVQGEINNKIDWFHFDKEEIKRTISGILGAESFDWHDFYSVRTIDGTENTLKDLIDNTINPLKSAYKTLEEGGTLGDDFFDQFPDLLQYANDADALKQHMQELINTVTESSLKELLLMYNSTDDEGVKAVLKQAIELLRVDRDITTEVEDTNDAYAKEKELIQANIDKLTETINKINKKLKKQKEAREELEKEKAALEEQAALYDSAVNAVTRQIDKQIDALERQKAAVEEYYDNQIDALKEEAEERDRINELREKELALEKAKNNKVRVYSASRGWTIQANTEEIEKAQKDYDDTVRNNQIADLEKEKEAALANYDAQIQSWNDYKDTWQEAVDAWKNGQDEMNAAAVFGKDWREKIASQDLGIVSQYQTEYGKIQDKIKDITDNQLKEIDEEIERLEKKLSVYEELRNDQKEYLDFYKNYSTEFAKATDEQTAALDRFRAMLHDLNEEGFDISKLMDMFESYDEMRKYFDSEYDKQGEKYGDKEYADAVTTPKTTHSRISDSAQAKLNRFLNSKLMQSIPTSIGSAFAKSNAVFNGLPSRDYNYAQNKVTNNSGATYNQQRTWVMEGSVIVDSYDKFKEYFDRYVREAKQDLVVGR